MNDITSKDNNEKMKDATSTNYTFETSKDNKDKLIDKEHSLNINAKNIKDKVVNNGEIIVTSVLECGEHENLQGVKINLYKINGLSPVLIKSKITDEEGKAIFSEIEEGCYRIIEIIDKKYFEKPKYVNWNEIIIDDNNKKQKVIVVNKIKKSVSQSKHKHWI